MIKRTWNKPASPGQKLYQQSLLSTSTSIIEKAKTTSSTINRKQSPLTSLSSLSPSIKSIRPIKRSRLLSPSPSSSLQFLLPTKKSSSSSSTIQLNELLPNKSPPTATTIKTWSRQDFDVKKSSSSSSTNQLTVLLPNKSPPTATTTKTWSRQDFDVGYELGQGAFGSVLIAREKKSQFICCLKVIEKKRLKGNPQLLIREIEIQKSISHPHVISLYQWFHDERTITLVLEMAQGGELKVLLEHQLNRVNKGFTEGRTAVYLYQISSALKALHDNHIIHRDIKPENMLIDSFGELKLCDFGWSKQTKDRSYTVCGTPDYISPEILKERSRGMTKTSSHDFRSDLWSIGVLMFELIVGEAPFSWTPGFNTWPRKEQTEKQVGFCDSFCEVCLPGLLKMYSHFFQLS